MMNQKKGSRNTAIGILTALLVAALILVSIIYWKHLNTKDALQATEKKLLHLNENLIPSKNAKITDLQKKLEKEKAANEARLAQLKAKYDADLSQIEELKTTREKMVELNKMLYARDQTVSQLEEKLESLDGDFEEEKKIRNALSVELSSKDALAASLQKERDKNQSNIAYLEEEMAKGRSEIQRLHEQLSALRGDKEIASSEMGRLKSTYDKLISDLHTQLKNHQVAIKTYKEKISVTFVDRILFDSGKATIRPEGRRVLKKVGQALKEVQDRQIRIIGHTDDIPIMEAYRHKFPTNWELSAARAAAVARYFQNDIGLDPVNLEAVGRSFYQPIASNETEQGRAQNRRVNIIIGPKIK